MILGLLILAAALACLFAAGLALLAAPPDPLMLGFLAALLGVLIIILAIQSVRSEREWRRFCKRRSTRS